MNAVRLTRLCSIPFCWPIPDRRLGLPEPTTLCGRLSLRAARKHFRRREWLSERAHRQSRMHRATRPFNFFGFGIDLQKFAMRIECRRFAEFERKVEPLAEKQNAIGLRQDLRKRTETRIGDAARTLHPDDGNLQNLLEPGSRLATLPRHQRWACENQRMPRTPQLFQYSVGYVDIEFHCIVKTIFGARHVLHVRLVVEAISRQTQVYRPGAPRACLTDCPHKISRDVARTCARECRLC